MKLTTTVVFLLACHLANAQFSKGDIFVAGGYSITVQKSDYDNGEDNKNRSFYVYPEIGYFLNHQYAVGGGLSFYSSRNRYEPSQGNYQEATDRALGAYLFVKRYFPISEKFFFSIDGSINYSRGKSTSSSGGIETTSKAYTLSLNASPSLIFFPSSNWAIEGSIGSISLSHARGISNESKTTSFGINYGSISLGLAYYFRRTAE